MARSRAAVSIRQPRVPRDKRCIKFSLRFLQLDHEQFPLEECDAGFLLALFKEVDRYQGFTVDEFREWCPQEHRHPINFQRIDGINGFPNVNPHQDEDMWTDEAVQFGLPGQTNESTWRVHGFLDGENFYIVWFDPHHRLD